MTGSGGRDLDHVVMPVASLGDARRILTDLGFLVAPDAEHPFGTANACVFFADDTYLEPLAVLDRDIAETRAAEGNAFVRRNLAFRLRHDWPGLSGFAVKSGDALADHETFRNAGTGGGGMVEFARSFVTPDGDVSELRFRLAFAADPHAPTLFIFVCERMSRAVPDRSALTVHSNGVRSISRLVYVADEPADFRPFFETTLEGRDLVANTFGFSMRFGACVLDVLTPDGLAARYGTEKGEGAQPRFAGVIFVSDQTARVPDIASAAGLRSHETLGRHIVTIGEGRMFFGFEAVAR